MARRQRRSDSERWQMNGRALQRTFVARIARRWYPENAGSVLALPQARFRELAGRRSIRQEATRAPPAPQRSGRQRKSSPRPETDAHHSVVAPLAEKHSALAQANARHSPV